MRGDVTSVLLSLVVHVGRMILAPLLNFSKNDKPEIKERVICVLPEKETCGELTSHPLKPEQLGEKSGNGVSGQLSEYWAIAKEVLTVIWLASGIQVRGVHTRLSNFFKTKNEMEVWSAAKNRDFNSDELKFLEDHVGRSPAVDAVLNCSLPASSRVKEAVPDSFLLQFAALTDDLIAQKCVSKLGAGHRPGEKHALFGAAERKEWSHLPWERRVNKHKQGLSFSLERKYMRKGLYLYRSVAVFEHARVDDFCRFILHSADRKVWDWSTINIEHLQTDVEAAEVPLDSDSSFIFTENKMPSLLANREYVAARRVWGRRDGGIYSISTSGTHPMAPPRRGRNVRVEDYTSAFVVRPLQRVNDVEMDAVEMTCLYFDDAKMRPMAYNIAMNASMWTGITTTDSGFRKYQSNICFSGSDNEENGCVGRPSSRLQERNVRGGPGPVVNFVIRSAVSLLPVVFVVGRLRGRSRNAHKS